jgi:hypothetical protein
MTIGTIARKVVRHDVPGGFCSIAWDDEAFMEQIAEAPPHLRCLVTPITFPRDTSHGPRFIPLLS